LSSKPYGLVRASRLQLLSASRSRASLGQVPLSHIATKVPAKQFGEVRLVIDGQDAEVRSFNPAVELPPSPGFPMGPCSRT
jgi:hypothetical protein